MVMKFSAYKRRCKYLFFLVFSFACLNECLFSMEPRKEASEKNDGSKSVADNSKDEGSLKKRSNDSEPSSPQPTYKRRKKDEPSRSNKMFFLSECLLNQNIRAKGVHNILGEGAFAPVVELLIQYGIGITTVACPEIAYEGLDRKACGKCVYQKEAYLKICKEMAQKFVLQYKAFLASGHKVGGFICVNGSPSCACDYCFLGMGQGIAYEAGLFIEAIQKEIEIQKLKPLNFIGIDKWNLDKGLNKIKTYIQLMNKGY